MRLMISVVSATEAESAIQGGADILDIKNPAEGSLGAQSPRIVRGIRSLSSGQPEVSAAIGDMPNLPGTAALAAFGAAVCQVDYVKVGLFGSQTQEQAEILLREVQDAVRGFRASVIAGSYADHERAGTLAPHCLLKAAASAGVRGFLIDTAVKDGRHLFNFIRPAELSSLMEQAHAMGMLFAAAGALREEDLLQLQQMGVDIAGVRSAVCRDGKRNGPLDPSKVNHILHGLRSGLTTA